MIPGTHEPGFEPLVVPYHAAVRVDVSDHAMWRAAERFPGFDTVLIEHEVREALRAGRITDDRRRCGLTAGWSGDGDLYVWSPEPDGRIYGIKTYDNRVVVATTMRRRP